MKLGTLHHPKTTRLAKLLSTPRYVAVGVLEAVVLQLLPALAAVSLLLEVFASSLYAASRNLLAIAVVDAAWFALVVAAILPVRV